MNKRLQWAAPALALSLGALPWVTAAANPAAATSTTDTLAYRSAFHDYKAWQDVKPADWRALNKQVGSDSAMPGMSGMQGHDMAMPAMPTSAAPAPANPQTRAPAASTPVQSGHHRHGGTP